MPESGRRDQVANLVDGEAVPWVQIPLPALWAHEVVWTTYIPFAF